MKPDNKHSTIQVTCVFFISTFRNNEIVIQMCTLTFQMCNFFFPLPFHYFTKDVKKTLHTKYDLQHVRNVTKQTKTKQTFTRKRNFKS